jgi:hypothetical protein
MALSAGLYASFNNIYDWKRNAGETGEVNVKNVYNKW